MFRPRHPPSVNHWKSKYCKTVYHLKAILFDKWLVFSALQDKGCDWCVSPICSSVPVTLFPDIIQITSRISFRKRNIISNIRKQILLCPSIATEAKQGHLFYTPLSTHCKCAPARDLYDQVLGRRGNVIYSDLTSRHIISK